MGEKNESDSTNERINQLEAKLIEQEHRPWVLIWNFIKRKDKWPDKEDPRRKASTKAIVWRFFANPTTIAIFSGGFIGIATLYFLWKQDSKLELQNKLIDNQNSRIEQQTYLIEADRRSAQVFIMGEVLSDINKELNINEGNERILSSPLIGRTVSLTNAMKPYRYLEGDSLVKRPLSPERGQLLVSLVESEIDTIQLHLEILRKSNFSYSDLSNADLCENSLYGVKLNNSYFSDSNACYVRFENANLSDVVALNSDLGHTFLRGASIKNSSFINCIFWGTDFGGINFDGVDLSNSDLMNAKFDSRSDFSNIKSLDSVFVNRYDWLTYLKDSIKVKGFDKVYNEYRIDSVIWDFSLRNERKPILVKKNKN